DDQGRVYRTQVSSVASDGTVGAALSTDVWYDYRDNVIKVTPPGGLTTKFHYDGAGRLVKEYQSDASPVQSWDAAFSVSGDTVLAQTEYSYDANSNVTLQAARQRFHDATGLGDLGSPTQQPTARVSYTAAYYDPADRLTATVDVGTNGGTAY